MAKSVPLSFKNNKHEMDMYEYIKAKSSPSAYVKELIEKDMSDRGNDGAGRVDMVIETPSSQNEIKLSSLSNMGR